MYNIIRTVSICPYRICVQITTRFLSKLKSNLPTAVQTLFGGSPHRGCIAAPAVQYDLPLVRLMYEYSWYEVPYWYEYLLPATYSTLP